MTTAEVLISRLPQKPMLTPQDVADAAGMKTAFGIINAIKSGTIDACKVGGRYIIAREIAITFIRKCSEEAAK